MGEKVGLPSELYLQLTTETYLVHFRLLTQSFSQTATALPITRGGRAKINAKRAARRAAAAAGGGAANRRTPTATKRSVANRRTPTAAKRSANNGGKATAAKQAAAKRTAAKRATTSRRKSTVSKRPAACGAGEATFVKMEPASTEAPKRTNVIDPVGNDRDDVEVITLD